MQFPSLTFLLATAGIAAAAPVEGSGAPLEARQALPGLSCPKIKLWDVIPIESAVVSSTCLSLVYCLPGATTPTKLPGLSFLDLSRLDGFKCSTCTCKGSGTGEGEVPGNPPATGGK